jgi:pimeloyl-ACP methyl ester carboxylesterase
MRRLVLNDIGPFVPRQALLQITSYVGQAHRFDDLEGVERHLRFAHAPFGPLPDRVWRRMAETGAVREGDGWRLHYDPGIAAPFATAAAEDVDLWALWDRIACPTFVLRGAESVVLPLAVAEEMRVRGPQATVASFAGVGHAPALVSMDQIATVAGWIEG